MCIRDSLVAFTNGFVEKTINEAVSNQLSMVKDLKDFFELNMKNLERNLDTLKGEQLSKAINKNHHTFLAFGTSLFDKQGEEILISINDILTHGIAALNTEIGNYIFETPEDIMTVSYTHLRA